MEIQRPYGREAVRRALVQAATSLIAKHGVEGVSTRTIAKEAQVNHGLITRHFGSKEGLVKEVAATIGRQLFQEVLYNEENLEAAWNRGFAITPRS
jgi:AcrR family transcriptional regulator